VSRTDQAIGAKTVQAVAAGDGWGGSVLAPMAVVVAQAVRVQSKLSAHSLAGVGRDVDLTDGLLGVGGGLGGDAGLDVGLARRGRLARLGEAQEGQDGAGDPREGGEDRAH
jgi:hypothetical protein